MKKVLIILGCIVTLQSCCEPGSTKPRVKLPSHYKVYVKYTDNTVDTLQVKAGYEDNLKLHADGGLYGIDYNHGWYILATHVKTFKVIK